MLTANVQRADEMWIKTLVLHFMRTPFTWHRFYTNIYRLIGLISCHMHTFLMKHYPITLAQAHAHCHLIHLMALQEIWLTIVICYQNTTVTCHVIKMACRTEIYSKWMKIFWPLQQQTAIIFTTFILLTCTKSSACDRFQIQKFAT